MVTLFGTVGRLKQMYGGGVVESLGQDASRTGCTDAYG
jgi:hypothetical protein